LKYHGRAGVAGPLGTLLAERWLAAPGCAVDGVLPVPLHPARLRERGFNQSALLAQGLAERLARPLHTDLLWRGRATAPQVGLSPEERLNNVTGAFRAAPGVRGGRWLLVDDVCTTGATLEACAAALRDQGARAVWAITLAHPFHG
jgi:ComF family protein